jgi:WD40 repeat protein
MMTETGSRLRALTHGYSSRNMAFFANDHFLVTTASHDPNGLIWDTNTWVQVASFTGHHGSITDVAVLQDRIIVTGGYDGTVRLWGVPTNE